jgi:hypothetical protein
MTMERDRTGAGVGTAATTGRSTIEGPPLERLTRRVLELPGVFSDLDRTGAHAVLHDVLDHRLAAPFGRVIDPERFERLAAQLDADASGRSTGCAVLVAWLLSDASLSAESLAADVLAAGLDAPAASLDAPSEEGAHAVELRTHDADPHSEELWMLVGTFAEHLASDADAQRWQSAAERREELVRSVLLALGRRPEGESDAQAQDRLSAVSSAQRRRVLAAARDAEARAAALREQLAAEAAQRSADKTSRE